MTIGIWQLVLILVLVLVLFGAGKLPKVMGDLGKGVKSFKDGMNAEAEHKDVEQKQIDLKDKDL
jgi:sec-independent protein translocase protein TatA